MHFRNAKKITPTARHYTNLEIPRSKRTKLFAALKKLFHLEPTLNPSEPAREYQQGQSPPSLSPSRTSHDHNAAYAAQLELRKHIRPYSPPVSPRTPTPYTHYSAPSSTTHLCPSDANPPDNQVPPLDSRSDGQHERRRRGSTVLSASGPRLACLVHGEVREDSIAESCEVAGRTYEDDD